MVELPPALHSVDEWAAAGVCRCQPSAPSRPAPNAAVVRSDSGKWSSCLASDVDPQTTGTASEELDGAHYGCGGTLCAPGDSPAPRTQEAQRALAWKRGRVSPNCPRLGSCHPRTDSVIPEKRHQRLAASFGGDSCGVRQLDDALAVLHTIVAVRARTACALGIDVERETVDVVAALAATGNDEEHDLDDACFRSAARGAYAAHTTHPEALGHPVDPSLLLSVSNGLRA